MASRLNSETARPCQLQKRRHRLTTGNRIKLKEHTFLVGAIRMSNSLSFGSCLEYSLTKSFNRSCE